MLTLSDIAAEKYIRDIGLSLLNHAKVNPIKWMWEYQQARRALSIYNDWSPPITTLRFPFGIVYVFNNYQALCKTVQFEPSKEQKEPFENILALYKSRLNFDIYAYFVGDQSDLWLAWPTWIGLCHLIRNGTIQGVLQ